jgi:hypothetical protein
VISGGFFCLTSSAAPIRGLFISDLAGPAEANQSSLRIYCLAFHVSPVCRSVAELRIAAIHGDARGAWPSPSTKNSDAFTVSTTMLPADPAVGKSTTGLRSFLEEVNSPTDTNAGS